MNTVITARTANTANTANTVNVSLHEIAHGRAGDKGNRLNVSVIAYSPDAWPFILEQITVDKVQDLFRHRGATKVVRHVVENLQALNFVIDDALEGGVNSGLNVDTHGKSNSYRVLGLPVSLPAAQLETIRQARSAA